MILADPPVPFETWGKRPGGIGSRAAEAHYSTMTWGDLNALGEQIGDVATKDCCLFLWVCQPLLIETLAMAKAWGFTYKTKAFSWVKLVPERGLTAHVGMGYWTRANTEDVLLFTRGRPERRSRRVYQLIFSLLRRPYEVPAIMAPVGRHSEKPAEIFTRIEALVGGPYLELFAREQQPGWTCLGNEIDGQDIRDALRALAAAPETAKEAA